MSEEQLSIQILISSRCLELGLRPVEVVRRCDYKSLSKGLRRLEDISRGYFAGTDTLIRGLPDALEVPAEVVKQAVEDTQRQLLEAQETAWREAFKPHAVILTERERPQPLFVAAFMGIDRLLRVNLDPADGPESYITQALDGVREKLAMWKGVLPAFGRPVGVIVNYTPDRAIRFDLDGNALEFLDRANRIGEAQFSLKGMGRPLSRGELDIIFGGRQINRGSHP
jgi:hypothetical protein